MSAPRLLIITDHAAFGRVLKQHASIVWPQAQCRIHSPARRGTLHPQFTALGYDAVLLDHEIKAHRARPDGVIRDGHAGTPAGGSGAGWHGARSGQLDDDHATPAGGERWLEDLLRRGGVPPILYFAPGSDPALAARACRLGAADCLARERIDHRRLADRLREALRRRRQDLALRRTSARAASEARFGKVTIGGHRCVRRLASGGSAAVYLAESERAGDMVVLKVLQESAEGSEQQAQYARFLREYELICAIRHPNVVRIFDLGIADDHVYIAMEYFPRGDLRTLIAAGIEQEQALRLLAQMAGALQAVHEVGVLHRDLKPGNIMLRADGSIAIIDFGLARQEMADIDMTGTGEIFGTPYYMSPEQGHGRPLDARSDLYSLGVVFHEMLTGRKPYLDSTPMGVIYLHANAPLPTLQGELEACQPLLERLLAKDPACRPASAGILLAEIQARLAAMAPRPHPSGDEARLKALGGR